MFVFSFLCFLLVSFASCNPSTGISKGTTTSTSAQCGPLTNAFFDSLASSTTPVMSFKCAALKELSGETYGPLKDCSKELSDIYKTMQTCKDKFKIPRDKYCIIAKITYKIVHVKYFLNDPANAIIISIAKAAIKSKLQQQQEQILTALTKFFEAVKDGEEIITLVFTNYPANIPELAEKYPDLAALYNNLEAENPEMAEQIEKAIATVSELLEQNPDVAANMPQAISDRISQMAQDFPAVAASYQELQLFVKSVLPSSILKFLQEKVPGLFRTITITKATSQDSNLQGITDVLNRGAQLPNVDTESIVAGLQSLAAQKPEMAPHIQAFINQISHAAGKPNKRSAEGIVTALEAIAARHPEHAAHINSVIAQLSSMDTESIVAGLQSLAAQKPEMAPHIQALINQISHATGKPNKSSAEGI